MVLVINRETCLLCKTDYGVGAGLNVQRLLLHWSLWAIDFQKKKKTLPTFSKVLAMEKFKTRTSDFCHKVKKGTNSTKRLCLMFNSLWKQHSSDTPVLFQKIPSLYMVALRVCQSQHSQFSLNLSWDLFLRCSHFPEKSGLELQKNFRHTVLFVRCWSTLLSNRPELTAVCDLAMTFRLLNQGIALIYFSSAVKKNKTQKKHLLPKFPTLPNLITCDFFHVALSHKAQCQMVK